MPVSLMVVEFGPFEVLHCGGMKNLVSGRKLVCQISRQGGKIMNSEASDWTRLRLNFTFSGLGTL